MINVNVSPCHTKLTVNFPYDPVLTERARLIPGRVWRKGIGWILPFTKEAVEAVHVAFGEYGQLSVNPEVNRLLQMQDDMHKEVVMLKSDPTFTDIPADFQFHDLPPMQHQRKALSLCLRRNAFALFMEMGSGKSRVICDRIARQQQVDGKGRWLVVAPVSVIHNWKAEFNRWQPGCSVTVLDGTVKQKLALLNGNATTTSNVFVVNYESAWRMVESLRLIPWTGIVLDEATKIKHRATKQARGIFKIAEKAPYRYILTGTPMPNSPLELFNQIRFLDPTVFGHNFYVFRDRYAVMGGYGQHQVMGWKNLDELSRKLAGVSYRVMKKDCLDLPEKIYKEFRLDMAEDQKKAYKEMADDFITEVGDKTIAVNVALAKLAKLRQIASGFVYDGAGASAHFKSNPKIAQLTEILEGILKEHKVVIWTNFKEEMQMIENLCAGLNQKPVIISGEVSGAERQAAVDKFQKEKDTRVFIGQQRAGGLGITLTAGDYCVFFSNDFSPEIRLQAEDRLHRIGQANHVTYIDLIMKGSVDAAMVRLLKKKQELSQQVTGAEIREVVYGGPEI